MSAEHTLIVIKVMHTAVWVVMAAAIVGLAEHNKEIFGGLFVAGELIWLWLWIRRRHAKKNGATRR